jgi:hypothetical protein
MAGVSVPQEEMERLMREVQSLGREEIEAFLGQYAEKVEKRKAYHRSRGMTDAQKESRKKYNEKRREREKLMLARARELGLVPAK